MEKIERFLNIGEPVLVEYSGNANKCICRRLEDKVKILALFDVWKTGFVKELESNVKYLDWLKMVQVESWPETKMAMIIFDYDYLKWNDVLWYRVLTALMSCKHCIGATARMPECLHNYDKFKVVTD